jgi:hypothetical protein
MSEFQDKVNQYKQTIVDEGFKPDMGGITESPTISIDMTDDVESQQEIHPEQIEEKQHQNQNKKTSRKKIEGLKRRVDEVTFERNVRAAQTQELMAKIQEQEQRLAEQQALLEQNEQYKNAYYENNLQTRESDIKHRLKIAKEEGDIEKEVELSAELSKVTADKSTYGLYKSQLKNQNQNPYNNYNEPNIYPEPTYGDNINYNDHGYDEPTNEAYESWLEKNSWADPESHNYSPRLRHEANELANELDETLRFNGNAEYIGTPDYFKVIDNLMSERYSVKKTTDANKRQNESQYYSVAPVSRSGSTMADQYMMKNPNNTRRHTSLTEDEYKIARNLQIKLPNGKYASGQEAINRYIDAKRMQNPNGSHKLVIE